MYVFLTQLSITVKYPNCSRNQVGEHLHIDFQHVLKLELNYFDTSEVKGSLDGQIWYLFISHFWYLWYLYISHTIETNIFFFIWRSGILCVLLKNQFWCLDF